MILLIDNYDSFTWNLVHLVAEAGGATVLPEGAPVLSALRQGRADRPTTALAPEPARTVAPAIVVARNDEITVEEALALDGWRGPSHLIVSPGPCGPEGAGVSVAMIRALAGRVPVLGVCLGHQCIAGAFGMRVERLPAPVHGLAGEVHHDGRGLFTGLPSPLAAARYHSLVVPGDQLEELKHGVHGEHGGSRGKDRVHGWAGDADARDGHWEVTAWAGTPHGKVVMGMRRVWADPSKAPLEGVQFHPESFLTEHGAAMMRAFLRG